MLVVSLPFPNNKCKYVCQFLKNESVISNIYHIRPHSLFIVVYLGCQYHRLYPLVSNSRDLPVLKIQYGHICQFIHLHDYTVQIAQY